MMQIYLVVGTVKVMIFYTINVLIKVLGKSETRKFCLFDLFPKERTYDSFGSERQSYDLIGRVHLDYMQLYLSLTMKKDTVTD